jgi:hypothetical protein
VVLYLVTAQFTATPPPNEVAPMIEGAVLPSLEILSTMFNQNRLAGGMFVGQHGFTFVVDAASHKDVDDLLKNLPFWSLHAWTVAPLVSFADALERERAVLTNLKSMHVSRPS